MLCFPDGVAGTLWGSLQPHDPFRSPHLLQLCAQTALQEHLLLLPAAHLQTEGGEAALRWWDSHYSHLQIHPSLQMWGVQLSRAQHPPKPSGLTRPRILLALGLTLKISRAFRLIIRFDCRTVAQDACCYLGSDSLEQSFTSHRPYNWPVAL